MAGLATLGSWPEKDLNRGMAFFGYTIVSFRNGKFIAVYLKPCISRTTMY